MLSWNISVSAGLGCSLVLSKERPFSNSLRFHSSSCSASPSYSSKEIILYLSSFRVGLYLSWLLLPVFGFFTNGQGIVSLKSCIFVSEDPIFIPLLHFKQYLHLVSVSACKVQNIIFLKNAVGVFFTTSILIFVSFLSSHLCMLNDSVLESSYSCFLPTLNM